MSYIATWDQVDRGRPNNEEQTTSVPDWREFVLGSATPECFGCGEPLAPPLVFWKGRGAAIAFHPHCAARFISSFLPDVLAALDPAFLIERGSK